MGPTWHNGELMTNLEYIAVKKIWMKRETVERKTLKYSVGERDLMQRQLSRVWRQQDFYDPHGMLSIDLDDEVLPCLIFTCEKISPFAHSDAMATPSSQEDEPQKGTSIICSAPFPNPTRRSSKTLMSTQQCPPDD